MSRQRTWMAALIAVMAAVAAAAFFAPIAMSADLKAVWLAGQFWDIGATGAIYAPADGLFTMRPPADWLAWLDRAGVSSEQVYPFLYPPLWAVAAGALPADFATLSLAALWINAILLAATILLAIRAGGAVLDPVHHVLVVLGIFALAPIASLALFQGQPHILVAFLIVLAVERSRAGAELTAGAVLALAASFKLFPLLYVALWIGSRQYRAVASFAVVGAALGALSLALAGWPLHQAFLDSISQIGRTLLVAGSSMSFDSLFAQFTLADEARFVTGAVPGTGQDVALGWMVFPRPAAWALAGNLLLIGFIAAMAVAARRSGPRALYTGIWPLTLTVSVLFAPTGWLYYLIPAGAFAPAIIGRLGWRLGGALVAAGTLAIALGTWGLFPATGFELATGTLARVTGALIWALGFALSARRGAEARS